MRTVQVLLVSLCAFGCSSSGSSQTGPVSGTVPGRTVGTLESFTAKGAMAIHPSIDTCIQSSGPTPVLLMVVVLDQALDTAHLQNSCAATASSTGVQVFVWTYASSGTISPGTYPTRNDATGGQVVIRTHRDATCNIIANDNVASTSGNVVIETNDSTHVVGEVNVSFPGGGSLAGRFDAPVVAAAESVCQVMGMSGGSPGPGCHLSDCVQ